MDLVMFNYYICFSGGFKVFGESKKYPREKSLELEFRGRLRVQLLNDDGTPINPIFATSKSEKTSRNILLQSLTLNLLLPREIHL
jgi:hypothetical protein